MPNRFVTIEKNAWLESDEYKDYSDPHAVISISSYSDFVPIFNPARVDYLPLHFDDVEPEDISIAPNLLLFSEADKRAIMNFVHCWTKYPFIVCCDAGISRSAAVGAYVSVCKGLDPRTVCQSPYTHPNAYILECFGIDPFGCYGY